MASAEAVEQVRRRRVGKESGPVRAEHRLPLPVRPCHPGRLRSRQGLLTHGVEAEPWGQHQSLLRAPDRHVDAPLVVAVVDRSERGDGVDQQQRGVAGDVERRAHRADAARHPGGGLVVHHRDRLDRAGAVLGEPRLDPRGVGTGAPVAFQDLDGEAEAAGHLRPQRREVSGLVHQHRVTGRERVHERRLPGAGAGGRKDQHVPARPEDLAQAGEHPRAEPPELGASVVDGGALDGTQDAVRDIGRARNLEEVPAGRCTHDSAFPRSMRNAHRAAQSVRRGAGQSYSDAHGWGSAFPPDSLGSRHPCSRVKLLARLPRECGRPARNGPKARRRLSGRDTRTPGNPCRGAVHASSVRGEAGPCPGARPTA